MPGPGYLWYFTSHLKNGRLILYHILSNLSSPLILNVNSWVEGGYTQVKTQTFACISYKCSFLNCASDTKIFWLSFLIFSQQIHHWASYNIITSSGDWILGHSCTIVLANVIVWKAGENICRWVHFRKLCEHASINKRSMHDSLLYLCRQTEERK
jgi:hypothetical protein